jgi:hypothetical protein
MNLQELLAEWAFLSKSGVIQNTAPIAKTLTGEILSTMTLSTPAVTLDWWSDETRSKVKQALARAGYTAEIVNSIWGPVMLTRPNDVNKFWAELKAEGLETDSLCQGVISELKANEGAKIGWLALPEE